MKIIIDESVDYYFVSELKSRRFTVVSIIKEFASLADEEIVSMSLTPPAIIITEDKDFGELVFNKQLCWTIHKICQTAFQLSHLIKQEQESWTFKRFSC